MKKTLCIILILSILSLSACNVAEPIDIPPELESPSDSRPESPSAPESLPESKPENISTPIEESVSLHEELEINPEINESAESPSGGYVPNEFFTKNYSEYLSFIDKKSNDGILPNNFISYEMIKDIGDFEMFETWYFPYYYTYRVIDGNGMEIFIYVDPLSNEISTENIILSNNSDNLRNVTPSNNEKRSVFTINNVSYRYYASGKLYKIGWVVGGKQIELGIAKDYKRLSDYPLDGETTFVSQLLSTQTAAAAVQSFNQKVEAEIAKNIANKHLES
jgi:hypothetical protein